MSSGVAIGLILFVGVSAAFAGFWHRIWRLGTFPSAVAAVCSAAATVAVDYVTVGELTANAVPIFAVLFAVAWAVAGVVQVITRRSRDHKSIADA